MTTTPSAHVLKARLLEREAAAGRHALLLEAACEWRKAGALDHAVMLLTDISGRGSHADPLDAAEAQIELGDIACLQGRLHDAVDSYEQVIAGRTRDGLLDIVTRDDRRALLILCALCGRLRARAFLGLPRDELDHTANDALDLADITNLNDDPDEDLDEDPDGDEDRSPHDAPTGSASPNAVLPKAGAPQPGPSMAGPANTNGPAADAPAAQPSAPHPLVPPPPDPHPPSPLASGPHAPSSLALGPCVPSPCAMGPPTVGPHTPVSHALDAHVSDPPGLDPRVSDPPAVDPRPTDPRASDPRASDPRAGDPCTVDPCAPGPRVSGSLCEDVQGVGAEPVGAELVGLEGVGRGGLWRVGARGVAEEETTVPAGVYVLPVWRSGALAEARERWPRAPLPASIERHRRDVEHSARLLARDGSRVLLAHVAPERLAVFLKVAELPLTTRALHAYAHAQHRRGHVHLWPPGRNKPCWCGSPRKYKRCCARTLP